MNKLLSICFFLMAMTYVLAQEEPTLIFEPAGGIHSGPVEVELSAGKDARIYYTVDGSTPSSSSTLYRSKIKVNAVSVIRAVAYVNGKRTDIVTQSYFCDRDYSLGVISIATDPGNLWDPATGIYVKGCCADTVAPYMGANYHRDWERQANIEMYEADGSPCFNQMAGIKIFGGFSRMLPQKSLAVIARKKYGKSSFKYPIFPARPHNKYKAFVIRNCGGDFNIAHLRDPFMTQLAKPTGVAIQEQRPIAVFINGQYWGIQYLREKTNEHYLEQNYGVDKDNVDILRHNGSTRYGFSKQYKYLLSFLRTKDMTDDATIDELRKIMDIEDFMRYNIAEIYSDNRDAGGNIKYWKERNDSSQWRWILYDLDLGLGNSKPNGYKHNTVKKFTSVNNEVWPDPPWSTFIIRSLLSNKKLEQQYIVTFADHLNTVYHPDTAVRLLNNMQEIIRAEMMFHTKRWNNTMSTWEKNVNVVRKFVKVRAFYLRQFVMEKFELKDTVFVAIDYPDEKNCKIQFNSLDISRDFKGIYFKDVPVTITVKPDHDYQFVGWKGRKEKEATLTISPKENLELIPLIEPKPKSAFRDSIIINEICYFQPETDSLEDWLEIYNRSGEQLDLSGWGVTDKTYKKRFVFPENTLIEPASYLILCQNRAQFVNYYGEDTIQSIGDLEFGLSSKGDRLKLYDRDGFLVDSVSYKGSKEKGDTLFSLALVHPDSLENKRLSMYDETPSPGIHNQAYRDYLKHEADKRYWTRIYYIGGGSFFFILAGGLLFFRYYKRKRKAQNHA